MKHKTLSVTVGNTVVSVNQSSLNIVSSDGGFSENAYFQMTEDLKTALIQLVLLMLSSEEDI